MHAAELTTTILRKRLHTDDEKTIRTMTTTKHNKAAIVHILATTHGHLLGFCFTLLA